MGARSQNTGSQNTGTPNVVRTGRSSKRSPGGATFAPENRTPSGAPRHGQNPRVPSPSTSRGPPERRLRRTCELRRWNGGESTRTSPSSTTSCRSPSKLTCDAWTSASAAWTTRAGTQAVSAAERAQARARIVLRGRRKRPALYQVTPGAVLANTRRTASAEGASGHAQTRETIRQSGKQGRPRRSVSTFERSDRRPCRTAR